MNRYANVKGGNSTPRQVIIGSYENELDAEIAKGHLEAVGIEATILKDDAGGMFPSLQQTSGVKLSVTEELVIRAKEILRGTSE